MRKNNYRRYKSVEHSSDVIIQSVSKRRRAHPLIRRGKHLPDDNYVIYIAAWSRELTLCILHVVLNAKSFLKF